MCNTIKMQYLQCNLCLSEVVKKAILELQCIYILNTCKSKHTFYLFISLPLYVFWFHASRFLTVKLWNENSNSKKYSRNFYTPCVITSIPSVF